MKLTWLIGFIIILLSSGCSWEKRNSGQRNNGAIFDISLTASEESCADRCCGNTLCAGYNIDETKNVCLLLQFFSGVATGDSFYWETARKVGVQQCSHFGCNSGSNYANAHLADGACPCDDWAYAQGFGAPIIREWSAHSLSIDLVFTVDDGIDRIAACIIYARNSVSAEETLSVVDNVHTDRPNTVSVGLYGSSYAVKMYCWSQVTKGPMSLTTPYINLEETPSNFPPPDPISGLVWGSVGGTLSDNILTSSENFDEVRRLISSTGGSFAQPTATLTSSYLSSIDVLFVAWVPFALTSTEMQTLQQWVTDGGILILGSYLDDKDTDTHPIETYISAFGLTIPTGFSGSFLSPCSGSHPILAGVSSLRVDHAAYLDIGNTNADVLCGSDGKSIVATLKVGTNVRVVFTYFDMYCDACVQYDNRRMTTNLIKWVAETGCETSVFFFAKI